MNRYTTEEDSWSKRLRYNKKIKVSNNLLTLWNEQRITEEEFTGIEEMIRSSDPESVGLADALIRSLHQSRAKLQIRRETKSHIRKLRRRIYENLLHGTPLRDNGT